MKSARAILKFVALGLAVAGAACLVIAFWDKIVEAVDTVLDKIEEKKSCLCDSDSEIDDFADVDL